MATCNSIEVPNIYPNLNDQQQFRLNKISEVRDCFIAEIRERELMGKRLTKYILNKSLIVLCAASGSISIASFASVSGAPEGIASASFSLSFSMYDNIIIKKYNKIVMWARSKLNSIESKIYEALINNEISHEDITTIINEEKN